MTCVNCGKSIPVDSLFCPYCGYKKEKKEKIKLPPFMNYIMGLLLGLLPIIIYLIKYKEVKDMPDIKLIMIMMVVLCLLSLIGLLSSLLFRLKFKKLNDNELINVISKSKKVNIKNITYATPKNKVIRFVDTAIRITIFTFLVTMLYTTIQSNGGLSNILPDMFPTTIIGRWDFECQGAQGIECVAKESYITFMEDNTLTCTEVYSNNKHVSCGSGTWIQVGGNVTITWKPTSINPTYNVILKLNGNQMTDGKLTLIKHN